MFAEQHYNARRAEFHGFGLTLNILDFSPEGLVTMVKELITNTSYHHNIQKASAVYKASPMKSQELATWWIEHVIKHGGRHLRSHSLDMPWYQYLMLDMVLFVCVIVFLVGVVVCCIGKACVGAIMKGSSRKQHKRD